MTGTAPSPSPGLSIRRSTSSALHADAAAGPADVRGPSDEPGKWTAPRLHRALVEDGLGDVLVDDVLPEIEVAVRAKLDEGTDPSAADVRAVLSALDVDALDGAFATAVGDAVSGDEGDRDRLRTLAAQLGTGQTCLDLRSDRDDLDAGAIRLLELADTTPVVRVQLGGRFATDRRPEQRRAVVDVLTALARGCRVELHLSGIAARTLHAQHRDQLPAHVTERCNPRRVPTPPDADATQPTAIEERVAEARADLDPDGTLATVLRALADAPQQSLTYAELRSQLMLDGSHPRTVAMRLEDDYGLAERLDRGDGTTTLSLLTAGARLVERLRDEVGVQSRFPDNHVDEGGGFGSRTARYTPPESAPPCRVTRSAHGEGDREDAAADAATGARPPEEADAPAEDRVVYETGRADVEWLSRGRQSAARGAARDGAVTLVDADLDRAEDGRTPWWGFDLDDEAVVVGGEYHNPLQWVTCLARALSNPLMWRRVLTPDRLEAAVEDLSRDVQRHARCLGWRADDQDGVEEFVDALEDARDELLAMTKDLYHGEYDDRDRFRSEITRYAHGLAGVVAHLLDMAGFELVREVRVPEFKRHFSRARQKATLAKTLSRVTSIQGAYGEFSMFRQLFEEREDRREMRMEPTVDATDPVGGLIGSVVVAGNGVDELEPLLSTGLEADLDVQEDAPDLALDVDVVVEPTVRATRETARRVLEVKDLELTREATAILHAFTRSPYAVASALWALEREDVLRDVQPDELRTGLATLDVRQFPLVLSRGARTGLQVLLAADEPISQAELERRGGPTPSTWRRHRDLLESADLVRETEDGWRAALPFRHERDTDVDLPWTIDPAAGRLPGSEMRSPADVAFELALGLVDDASRFGDVDDPLGAAWAGPPDATTLRAALRDLEIEALDRWLVAGCDHRRDLVEERRQSTVRLGRDPAQTPVTNVSRPA